MVCQLSESIGGLIVPSCGHFAICSTIWPEPSLAGRLKDSDRIALGVVKTERANPASDPGSRSVCAGRG